MTGPVRDHDAITLFLCGDVMLGRGVDQIFPHACPPVLHERWMTSALDYVALAERENGPIPRAVSFDYVWGDALAAFDRMQPDARIINLETAITTSDHAWPKGINYRMHPDNVSALTAARIDCCVLSNNHVLDWGTAGLQETLRTLAETNISISGAGLDSNSAQQPAVLDIEARGRVLIFGLGAQDSGIPPAWAAGPDRAGVQVLADFNAQTVATLMDRITAVKRKRDVVVASIHWGGNWGFEIPPEHRRFAHALLDTGAVDVIHGHSSHHPKAIEIYRGRPIIYGCGDFLDDYEGIRGYEEFRDDLVLMYFVTINVRTGTLLELSMYPLQIRNFRLQRPAMADRAWLALTLDRECRRFGSRVSEQDGMLWLHDQTSSTKPS